VRGWEASAPGQVQWRACAGGAVRDARVCAARRHEGETRGGERPKVLLKKSFCKKKNFW